MRWVALGLLGALLGCAGAVTSPPKSSAHPLPSNLVDGRARTVAPGAQAVAPALRAVLSDALDGDMQRGVGAAWIDGETDAIVTLGTRAHDGRASFDRHTIFPIGSVSKVFVSLLLAEALRRHEIASLDGPIAPLWKDKMAIPRGVTREISWEDLATHRSGLPFFPSNWVSGTEEHRAGYTLEELRIFLASYTLSSEPGTKVVYGNTGYGLLALSLAEVTHQSFGDLLRSRILRSLGMTESDFPDHEAMPPPNFLEGWNEAWSAEPWKWDPSPMAPCCVVRSSLGDLVRFARALMQPGTTWNDDLQLLGRPRADAPWGMGESFGLGITGRDGGRLLFKDGQVHGIRTFLILEPAKRSGLVVVANSYRVDIGDLAWRLWDVAHGDPSGSLATSVSEMPPSTATPSGIVLSDDVTLRAFAAPESARPGETVTCSVYFECTTDSAKSLRAYSDLWMGARDGRIIRTQRLAPEEACTRGKVFRQDFLFTLPRSSSLRRADLWVGLTSTERRSPTPDAAFHGNERHRLHRIRVVDPDRAMVTWGE